VKAKLHRGGKRKSQQLLAASDFFVAKICHIATKKKRSQATGQGNFLKNFQKNCHISGKLEELGRFLVFFF
jgi:hypothetical protein